MTSTRTFFFKIFTDLALYQKRKTKYGREPNERQIEMPVQIICTI